MCSRKSLNLIYNDKNCTCSPSAHTPDFLNDLQTVGKEHVLRPVGGASVPSTCR